MKICFFENQVQEDCTVFLNFLWLLLHYVCSCSLCIGCVHRMCISATAMTLIYLKCRKKEEVISAMKWQKKQIQTINHGSWSQSARQTSQIAFLSQTISLTLVSFFCQSFFSFFQHLPFPPLFYFFMWLGKKNPLVLKYYKSLSVQFLMSNYTRKRNFECHLHQC